MIDDQGRVFGRVNLIDAAAMVLVLLLIPLGYGTYLLFRPSAPRIESVAPSLVTREEERISIGGRLAGKFKVRGSGFSPLMRARIGDADAMAFVFESPNSADVLVGPMPPGAHDLVLVDGVQEVARAKGAITIQAEAVTQSIRAVGWLTGLDEAQAKSITVGTTPPQGDAFRVLALGPPVPGFRRVSLAGSTIEIADAGTQARRAVLLMNCGDAFVPNPCTLGNRVAPVTMSLTGPTRAFHFEIDEIVSASAPVKAAIRVRLQPGSPAIVSGDRDDFLDERAAIASSTSGDVVVFEAGIDRHHDGWHYRSQRLVPGAPFVFKTDRYEARGVVVSIDMKATQP